MSRTLEKLKSESGLAAVEFAILAPVIILILLAIVEIGSVIFSRIATNSAIAAATNAIILSDPSNLSIAPTAQLSQQIRQSPFVSTATVNINQAFIAETSDSTLTSGNSDMTLCYCPIFQNGSFTWGSSVTCGANCANPASFLTTSGKFAFVEAQFSPPLLFGRFLPEAYLGKISASARIE